MEGLVVGHRDPKQVPDRAQWVVFGVSWMAHSALSKITLLYHHNP
jgi:hypothetical protein